MVATQSGDVSVLALPANDGDRRRADPGAVTGAPLSLIRIEANGTLTAVSVSSSTPLTSQCPFVVPTASGNVRGSVAAVLSSNLTIDSEGGPFTPDLFGSTSVSTGNVPLTVSDLTPG